MTNEWKTIGLVGVDSGCLMIGDPCYLDDDTDWNPELYDKWIVEGMCRNDKQAIQIDEMCPAQAVAFSSGFGDGVYEVRALYRNYGSKMFPDRRIKEVRIICIN